MFVVLVVVVKMSSHCCGCHCFCLLFSLLLSMSFFVVCRLLLLWLLLLSFLLSLYCCKLFLIERAVKSTHVQKFLIMLLWNIDQQSKKTFQIINSLIDIFLSLLHFVDWTWATKMQLNYLSKMNSFELATVNFQS